MTDSSLQSDVARIAELAAGRLDHRVPDCGDWLVSDVLTHLAGVYAMVTEVLRTRATGPVRPVAIDGDPAASFATRSAELLSELASIEPTEPVWTWTTDRTAGFYARRMANETLVHRCDIERAMGGHPEIDRDRAVDVIDEYFDLMLPGFLVRKPERRPSGSLHLHCTDGPGEWLVVSGDEGFVVERVHAKGDCAWRGPAGGLALAVWGRAVESVEVVGSVETSQSWRHASP